MGSKGIVKWFDESKGYGFIQSGRENIFVHYSGIATEGFKTLSEGQRVVFDVVDSPRGPKAINVKIDDDRFTESSVAVETDSSVTDRFTGSSVTDRFENAKVTDILSQFQVSEQHLLSALTLKRGDLIKDCYRIEEGPIGAAGEAEVFRCRDEQTGTVVALKFYRYNVVPKGEVLKQLLNLNHQDIVSLKDCDTWMGRFYEVMEFCEGGRIEDYAPLSEDDLRDYIKEIVSGLNFCHDMGIIHRDIKPSNIFFRFSGKKDLVIADFGISSILKGDEKVKKTETFKHLTLDYASPELLSDKLVSSKTDYYSLGITIIHLFRGISPFIKMDERAILAAHFQGRVPIPENISPEFRQLIKGLIQINPENRWGYKQVQCWLKEEPILTDDGLPWKEDRYAGRESPYPSYPQAKNPVELAAALDKFDSAKQLFRGDIMRWVFDHFDAALAERIEAVQENYSDRPALGVHKLRYLLDPTQPLIIGGHRVSSLDDLVTLLQTTDEGVLKALEDALWGEFIECWIDTANIQQEKDKLLNEIKSIRKRLKEKNRRLGVFALLWHLYPSYPFPFSSNEVATPEELAALIVKDEASKKLGIQVMTNEWLKTWLLATGRMADPKPYDDVVKGDGSHERKLEAILHLLSPKLPLPKITVDKKSIDVGKVSTESEKFFSIKFSNTGRGFLSGSISLSNNGGGFAIDQRAIEGGPVTVRLTIRPLGLPAGSFQKTTIVADTNGGKLEIPVTYKVTAPVWKMVGRSVLSGLFVAMLFGGLRAIPSSPYKYRIMDWMDWNYLVEQTTKEGFPRVRDAAAEYGFWGFIFSIMVGGGIYYLIRMASIRRK